jgi:hypothetical protein
VRTEQGEPPWTEGDDRAWIADALRSFHDDDALRALTGGEPSAARTSVRTAIERAFGDDDGEEALLRRALEMTYLDPSGGHSAAQRELFMSRSSFYRLLQKARRVLAEDADRP